MPAKIYDNGTIVTYTQTGSKRTNEENVRRGKSSKTYKMTWKLYRQISSSAVRMFDTKTNNLTFWTFTTDGRNSYPECVRFFSKFLDNLKKNYGLQAYIWTGELGDKGKLPHFHMIADMPFIDLQDITNAYCSARGYYSNSAVRLPKNSSGKTCNSVVKSVGSLCRYLCKYMSKSIATKMDMGGRVYGMSQHLTGAAKKVEYKHEVADLISSVASSGYWTPYKMEYCTIWTPNRRLEDVREMLDSIDIYSTEYT